ncbi:MAG: Hsp70 family protein, partial [Campylobacteraceae bacterium]|nr:Hsp70 family protein [Campylobacteraceae bacterium]
ASGKAQEIKITGSSGLDEKEIEKMVKDAELHKEEDKKRKEVVDTRNTAEALIHQTEKSLKDLGENIPADDKSKIEKALNELKETLKNENASKDEIDAKVKALTEASHKLAEEIYKKEQGGNEAKSADSAKKDDDVIDAEVE